MNKYSIIVVILSVCILLSCTPEDEKDYTQWQGTYWTSYSFGTMDVVILKNDGTCSFAWTSTALFDKNPATGTYTKGNGNSFTASCTGESTSIMYTNYSQTYTLSFIGNLNDSTGSGTYELSYSGDWGLSSGIWEFYRVE